MVDPITHETPGLVYELIPGDSGTLQIASGRVSYPDGKGCADALVTIEQHGIPRNGRSIVRWLHTTTNDNGTYGVFSDVTSKTLIAWAAHPDGYLGLAYVDRGVADIQFEPGSTSVYVRDENCQPVSEADVIVHECGIEDLTHRVPPNIQKLLTRRTDRDGIAKFRGISTTGGLGDQAFEVRHNGMAYVRDTYSGSSGQRLFVLTDAYDSSVDKRCANSILGADGWHGFHGRLASIAPLARQGAKRANSSKKQRSSPLD
ncbi:MAG: hypothetical protein R3C05_10170 [Pirellulaceae bacterium]